MSPCNRLAWLCVAMMLVRPVSSTTVCCTVVGEDGFNADGSYTNLCTLTCPVGTVMTAIPFAGWGTPTGTCGNFSLGWCDESDITSIASSLCIGNSTCSINACGEENQNCIPHSGLRDPCVGTHKSIRLQATCATPTGQPTTSPPSQRPTTPFSTPSRAPSQPAAAPAPAPSNFRPKPTAATQNAHHHHQANEGPGFGTVRKHGYMRTSGSVNVDVGVDVNVNVK
jgi:hypothetical protein